jgi:hypothetical protein
MQVKFCFRTWVICVVCVCWKYVVLVMVKHLSIQARKTQRFSIHMFSSENCHNSVIFASSAQIITLYLYFVIFICLIICLIICGFMDKLYTLLEYSYVILFVWFMDFKIYWDCLMYYKINKYNFSNCDYQSRVHSSERNGTLVGLQFIIITTGLKSFCLQASTTFFPINSVQFTIQILASHSKNLNTWPSCYNHRQRILKCNLLHLCVLLKITVIYSLSYDDDFLFMISSLECYLLSTV